MIRHLFVINLKALLIGIFRMRRMKTNIAKKAGLIVLFVFIIASLMGTFGSLFYFLCDPLFNAGIGWFYFSLQAILSFALGVFGTIFSAQTIFKAKDNELLLSMPIKPFDILISRFLVILFFEYIFELIIAVPAFIIWIIGGHATGAGILLCLIAYAFLPFMSLSVACLVAWLISSLFTKFRHNNIITLVIAVALLWLYLRLYSQMQVYFGVLLNRGVEIAAAFRKAMPPFYAFGSGIVNRNLSDASMFCLWALAPFVFTIAVIMLNYQKILTTDRGTAKAVYKEKDARISSACWALTKKELAHYLAKPMVVLNTSISSLLMLMGAAMMIARRAEFAAGLAQISGAMGHAPLPVMAAAALTLMGGINNLSASLISLEGKHLWIAKTIPVEPKAIYLSKIYTHLISSAIPCLIASLPAVSLFAATPAEGLLIVMLPQTYIILIAATGLSVNLIFPRFDWVSEIQPVKQGAAAMIIIFGSMIFVAALIIVYIFILSRFMDVTAFAWVMAVIFAAASFLVWKWLIGPGVKRLADL